MGPTMSILAENAKVDYSGMGSALASRGFGYLIANLFGAMAEKIVLNHSEVLLTVAFIFPSIGRQNILLEISRNSSLLF